MPRRITIVLVLALVAATALVLWWTGSREDAGRQDPVERAVAERSSASTELGGVVEPVAREPLDTPAIEAAAAPDPDAVLLVRTISAVAREPLSRIRLTLFPNDPALATPCSDVESARGSLAESPVTGADGRAEFQVRAGIDLTLWFRGAGARAESGMREVPPLRPGERREMIVELATGNDLRFFGRVVRRSDRAPVLGARVRALAGDLSAEDSLLAETSSDADGLFELALPSWIRPHLRVEAAGYGLAVVTPTKDHDSPDRAFVVALPAGATLDARVLDASGAPIAGATVRLTARSFELRRESEDDLSNLAAIPDEVREASTAADGSCELQDLPPRIQFWPEILRDGVSVRRESEPIVLSPGQRLEREWRIGGGGSFVGVVVDQLDQPLAGLEIWLAQAASEAPRFFQPHESRSMVAKTSSDAEGRFAFHDVAPGAWSIGPGAGSISEPSSSDVASRATRFEMTGAERREITLQVHRGVFIRGRVVDPAGEPQAKAFVLAWGGERSGLQADCGEDGRFALGPLVPGRYTLIALSGGNLAPSEPVEASAGQEDVELHLRPGGSLRGRVVDARTGEGSQAEMRLALEGAERGWDEYGIGWTCSEDGTFEADGLTQGLYGLSAETKDGRFGVLQRVGVSTGKRTGDLVVAVSPGGTLRLRYEGSRSKVACSISFQGVPIGWARDLQAGDATVRLAPAGTLLLGFSAEDGQEISTRTVELATGEEKEILFRDGD